MRIEQVVEIVAVAGQVGGQQTHVAGIEQIAADVVESTFARTG